MLFSLSYFWYEDYSNYLQGRRCADYTAMGKMELPSRLCSPACASSRNCGPQRRGNHLAPSAAMGDELLMLQFCLKGDLEVVLSNKYETRTLKADILH